MKSVGHTKHKRNLQLDEVVLVATSEELRKSADLLVGAARRMDEMGEDFDHEHLTDCAEKFEASTELIAVLAD